ncbi:MAG: hypothetical protein ACI33K_06145 [Clostridiaceae bacterium]
MKNNVIYVDFVSKTRRKFFSRNILRLILDKLIGIFKKDKPTRVKESKNHKKIL